MKSENLDLILKSAAAQSNISFNLLKAIALVESSYNPAATGKAGEIGLFQIHPATWKGYQSKTGITFQQLRDPTLNTRAALMILQDKAITYRDPLRAIIGYNGHNGRFTIAGTAYLNRVLSQYSRLARIKPHYRLPTEEPAMPLILIGSALAAHFLLKPTHTETRRRTIKEGMD